MNKDIDAAVTVDPDATIFLNKLEGIEILRRFYRGDILDPYPATCNIVHSKFLLDRGPEFGIIVRGLQRAIDDIERDPASALAVMAAPAEPEGLHPYVAIDRELTSKVGIPLFAKDYKEYGDEIRTIMAIYADKHVIEHLCHFYRGCSSPLTILTDPKGHNRNGDSSFTCHTKCNLAPSSRTFAFRTLDSVRFVIAN